MKVLAHAKGSVIAALFFCVWPALNASAELPAAANSIADSVTSSVARAQASASKTAASAQGIASPPHANAAATPPLGLASAGINSKQPQAMVEEDKPVDWFARIAAIAGLLIGVGNFFFTLFKMRRDRRLSIEDDFWFRKIVTPAAIEPMMGSIANLASEIPGSTTSPEVQRVFALKVTTEFSRLYSAVQALGLFDAALPGLVEDHLRRSEDMLSEYCGKLARDEAVPSAAEVRHTLWTELRQTLEIIKSKHLGS